MVRYPRFDPPRARLAAGTRLRRAGWAFALMLALAPSAEAARIVGLLDPLEPEPRSMRPGSGATESDFRRFAERWVGRWSCSVREWDGVRTEPIWESNQRRTFTLTLQGQFLEEAAYVFDPSGWIQSGLQLLSFDPDHGRVLQSGFWSNAPGRLFAVDAVLQPSEQRIEGVMTLRVGSSSIEKRRVSLGFESPARAVYRIFRQRPDGSEYLHEELVYERLRAD